MGSSPLGLGLALRVLGGGHLDQPQEVIDVGVELGVPRQVGEAMSPIRAITPGSGSYVNETDYFEPDWQASFWGANYPRLLEIKRSRDPGNLLRVHHGVGSEEILPGPAS